MRTLLIHGVLHLLGYDHERSAAEARRMRAMERRLLGSLNQTGDADADASVLRSPHPALSQRERKIEARQGCRMDDVSLKDRIAALEERLNTFGRHL